MKSLNKRLTKLFVLSTILTLIGHTNLTAQTYATVPYSTGFETGAVDASWTTWSSLPTGEIAVFTTGVLTFGAETAYSHSGNYFLGLHNGTPGGTYNTNNANLHLNLAGESNLRLDFWWAEWNDETEPQDGVYISHDGGLTFVKVLDLNGASYTDLTWTHFDLSLDSINAAHGLIFTTNYIIMFQQYDNYYFAGGNDGFLFDDIQVGTTCPVSNSMITPSVCDSYTVPSGDETYTTSGLYYDTIPNAGGCDSIISIDLMVNATTSTLTPSVCVTYTAPDAQVYTTSGMYVAVIPNAAGCDSTITIDLTVGANASAITEVACDSYTAPDTQVYTTTGMYVAVIQNAAGCDSTITIDLTVNASYSSTITESACDSYTAPDAQVYTTSGMYSSIFTNAAGCDSIIMVDLTITASTSSSITTSAIDTYTAPSGAVYTSSGIYYDTIANAAGCDSIITIDLSIGFTGLENMNTIDVQIYPNPTTGIITISDVSALGEIIEMYIVDNVGARVMDLDPTVNTADLSELSNGVYYLEFVSSTGTHRINVVKQ